MSDPDDEILFVDYNTPDDHPTSLVVHDALMVGQEGAMIFRTVRQHVHLRSNTHCGAEAQSMWLCGGRTC